MYVETTKVQSFKDMKKKEFKSSITNMEREDIEICHYHYEADFTV